MMLYILSTKVRQSAPECEIRWYNTENCARVKNNMTKYGNSVKSAGGHWQWLLIGNDYQKVLHK